LWGHTVRLPLAIPQNPRGQKKKEKGKRKKKKKKLGCPSADIRLLGAVDEQC